jgi:hypothetical protein
MERETIRRNRSEFIVNFHFRLKIVDKPHEKNTIFEPESGYIVLSRVCSYLLLLQDKWSNLDHKNNEEERGRANVCMRKKEEED